MGTTSISFPKIVSYAETPPTLQESLDVASIEVPFQTAVQYAQSDYWKEIDCIYSVKDNLKHYPILVSQEGDGVVTVNGMSGNCSMEVAENSTIEIKPATGKTIETSYLILYDGKDVADEMYDNGLYTFTLSAYHNRNIIKTVAYPMTKVTVSQSGTLLDGIGIENIDNIHYLKVSGDMNGTDILAIRKMTNLRLLDMEDANIVNGGISYYENYTTSENEIGSYFFKDKTNLVKIRLPKTVTTIKERAFYGMSNLVSVYISHSVVSIGSEAFESCGLTSVTIPENVTAIGSDAFYGCRSLRELILSDGTNTLSTKTYYYSPTPFGDCPIEKLYLGRNVSYSSNDSPFRDNKSLTSVTIGDCVTSIGSSTFSGCSGLTEVHIKDLAAWCKISFGGDNSNPLNYAHHLYMNGEEITNLVIPNSVTSIGSYAFLGCSGLTSVTIPNSVTSIGSSAFRGCSGLTSVTIPNSVTSIGSSAFSGCSGLTSVTIPNSVTSIGSSAFKGCSGLTSVTIGNSVTSIGSSAFSGCSGLTSVTSLNTTPPAIQQSTFDEATEKSATLHVPEGCKTIYWLHPYWENFTKVMDDGLITDIHDARTDTEERDGNNAVYTLNGTKVNVKDGGLNSLPRGIYVRNGKKTIVK